MSIKKLKKAVAAGLAMLLTVSSFNVTGINVSAAGLPTTDGHDKYVDKDVFDVISAEDFGSKPLDAPLFDKTKGSQDITELQVPTLAYDDTSISLVWMKPEKYDNVADYNVYVNGKLDGTARESYEKNASWADAYMKAFYEYYKTASDVPMVEIDIHSYRATGLTPDTEYTFKVVAIDKDGKELGTAKEIKQKTTKTPEVFNIEDYGAVAEAGATGPTSYDDAVNAKVEKNTKAIQDAIDACTPGGKVVIPEGKTYVSGALWLKSDMTLEVNGTLWASPNSDHFEIGFLMYPFYTDTRGWGLVNATSADEEHPLENIRITGTGTLYGNGWKYGAGSTVAGDGYTSNKGANTQAGDPKDTATWGVPRWVAGSNSKVYTFGIQAADSCRKWLANLGKYTQEQINTGSGVSSGDLKNAYATRSSLLIMRNISNVYVGDITIENPSNHSVNILDSRNISTENVKVFSYDGNNADGLGFGCSQNVICWNNFTDTGDDNLGFGASVGEAARDCDIQTNSELWMFNNFVREGHGGLAAGSHTGNGIQDVLFEDTIMNHIDMAFRFKSAPTNGGFGANITMRDCAVADTDQAWVFTTSYSDPNSASSTEFAEIGEFYNFAAYNNTFYKVNKNTVQVLADVDSVGKPYNPWHTHHNMYFQDVTFGDVGASGSFANKNGWETLIGAENMVFYNFKTVSYDAKAVSAKTDKTWNNLQYCKNIQFQGTTLDSVNTDKTKLQNLMSQINVPANAEVKAEEVASAAQAAWAEQAANQFMAGDEQATVITWDGKAIADSVTTVANGLQAKAIQHTAETKWTSSNTSASDLTKFFGANAPKFATRVDASGDKPRAEAAGANLGFDGRLGVPTCGAYIEYTATADGELAVYARAGGHDKAEESARGICIVDADAELVGGLKNWSGVTAGGNITLLDGNYIYGKAVAEVKSGAKYYIYDTDENARIFGITFTPKTEPDTGSSDTGSSDTGSSDTGSSDTGSSDTGSSDTGSSDTGSSDTGSSDTGSSDTGSSDTGSSDTGSSDTGSSDTGSSDTGSSDTGSSDTGSSDTGSSDTGSSDTGSSDTGSSDTGSSDTGSTDTGSSDTGSTDEKSVVWDGSALTEAAAAAKAAKSVFTAVGNGEGLYLSNGNWSTVEAQDPKAISDLGLSTDKAIGFDRPKNADTGKDLAGEIPTDKCFIKYEATKDGVMKVYLRGQGTKKYYAVDSDGTATEFSEKYKNYTKDDFIYATEEFPVVAGKTYYFYPNGQGGRIFQLEFTPDPVVEFNTMYFDFGISADNVADGWTGVTVNGKGGTSQSSATYGYTKEKGYGIISAKNNVEGRAEAVVANPNYPEVTDKVYGDCAILQNDEFAVDVPNGAYDVYVIVGSPNANETIVSVEDFAVRNHKNSDQGFDSAQFDVIEFNNVVVKDKQLNIKYGDALSRTNGIIIKEHETIEVNLAEQGEGTGLKTLTTYGKPGVVTFEVNEDMPVRDPESDATAKNFADAGGVTYNGKTYTRFVQGSTGGTATAFLFTAHQDSRVTLISNAMLTKVWHFVEDSTQKDANVDGAFYEPVMTFDLKAGETYTYYADGSKPMVCAIYIEGRAGSGSSGDDPVGPADGAHSVKLTWPAVTNDTAVFYGVETYVGGQKVDTVDGIKETSTTIGRLSGGVEYTFKVYVSEQGDTANSMPLTAWNRTYLGETKITTAADTSTEVAAPKDKAFSLSNAYYRHAQASWKTNANDERVRGYKIYINGSTEPIKTIYNYEINGYASEKAIGKQVGRLVPGQENTVKLTAFTDSGLEVAYDEAKITTLENYDYKAPVFAADAKVAVEVKGEDVVLTWPAATDDTAVKGYRVYVDGKPIVPEGKSFNPVNGDNTTTETTYTVSGLDLKKDHTFTIQAGDTWWKAAQTMGTFDKMACYNWTVKGISVTRKADGSTVDPGPDDPTPDDPVLEGAKRIADYTRYGTALKSADLYMELKGVEKLDAIVIAGADSFPDALTGSTLAAAKEAPIVLAGKSAEDTLKTIDYVKANVAEGGMVYILGGTSSVPQSVTDALSEDYEVILLAGMNRYETNISIVHELNVAKGTDVLIASGSNFPDSISVSGVAGAKGMPIFLTAGEMTDETIAAIKEIAPEHIYLIGGTAAVSATAEAQAKELCESVERVAGTNRYESSVAIAEKFNMTEAGVAVIAYGRNFPDGLTGGILAAELNAPVILVEDSSYDLQAKFIKDNGIKGLYVLGGTGVISEDTVNALLGE